MNNMIDYVEIKRIKMSYEHRDRDKPTYLVTNKKNLMHSDTYVMISSFDDIVIINKTTPLNPITKEIKAIEKYFKQLPFKERIERIKNVEKSLRVNSKFNL